MKGSARKQIGSKRRVPSCHTRIEKRVERNSFLGFHELAAGACSRPCWTPSTSLDGSRNSPQPLGREAVHSLPECGLLLNGRDTPQASSSRPSQLHSFVPRAVIGVFALLKFSEAAALSSEESVMRMVRDVFRSVSNHADSQKKVIIVIIISVYL